MGMQGSGPSGWQQAPDGSWHQAGVVTNSSKATASLIFGILGIVLCPLICSIVALVLGYQARGEIDRSGGAIGGRGNATAGVVLGWIGVGLVVLGVVLLVILAAVGTHVSHDLQTLPSSTPSVLLIP